LGIWVWNVSKTLLLSFTNISVDFFLLVGIYQRLDVNLHRNGSMRWEFGLGMLVNISVKLCC